MLSIERDIGRNHSCYHGMGAVLGLVVLVVDFAYPTEASGHHQLRRDCIVVCQQEAAAQRRFVLLAVERIGSNHKICRWSAVKTVVTEAVPPLAVMHALFCSQSLIDGEAPHMLDVRIDKWGKALVAVQPANTAARTIRVGKILQQTL